MVLNISSMCNSAHVCVVCQQVERSKSASEALVSVLQAKITALTLENQQLTDKLKVWKLFFTMKIWSWGSYNRCARKGGAPENVYVI